MPQTDQVWKSLVRRGQPVAVRSGRTRRHRLTFDDGLLAVCLLTLSGLILLGGLIICLSWVAAALPPRVSEPCPESERCVTRSADGDESVWADDALAARLMMTR
jgi:hypothetical protein